MTREPRVTVDFETRSEANLKDVGAWRYAAHPSTEILFLAYKMPGEETRLWWPEIPFPDELVEAATAGLMFEAHNIGFERAVWIYKLTHLCPVPKKWADTMAVCAYRAVPLKLDEVGKVLKLDVQKDARGKYLINTLSKPRKPRKAEREAFADMLGPDPSEWPTLWREDEDLMQEFGEYCEQDVDAEHLLSETLGDLPTGERKLWLLDQKINQRGVAVDLTAVAAAKKIVEQATEKLTQELVDLTEGDVTTGGQRDRLLSWLANVDYPLPDMTKATVEEALEDPDIPTPAYKALKLRQSLSRTSTSKLDKMEQCVSADGRIRGTLQYHSAATGRWGGRLIQPQNLKRSELNVDDLVAAILYEDVDLLEVLYGDAAGAVSESMRGMLVAGPGKDLIVADFSAIEARVLAWLADEEWKLGAFRNNEPIYEKAAELIFGYPVNKNDHPMERHAGKTAELAFGYGGGLGAWRNFDNSDRHTDADVEFYKKTWRERHPSTTSFWYGLQDAALAAMRLGKRVTHGPVAYEPVKDRAGNWLTCILPNGRRLWYYDPIVREEDTPVGRRPVLSYWGRDSHKQNRWGRVTTWGGKLAENVTQAVSRDLMAEGMFRVEAADYPIILTVHDEIVCEVDEGTGSVSEFENLMAELPVWAEGCPVAAVGFRTKRYRKG